ncbi:MAG: DUF2520 domain-containing protein [Acidobacteriota bacterium]
MKPSERPIKTPWPASLALVGPGKVGRSLGAWFRATGGELRRLAGRRTPEVVAARFGAAATKLGRFASDDCDLLLIAVSDPALDAVVAALAERPQAPVVLHTAGNRGASALEPLRTFQPEIALGTLHPLKAFPEPLEDPAEGVGIFFALDGDRRAREAGRILAERWRATSGVIAGPDRILYHLAATLSAGGVVTLVAAACALARRLDLPQEVSRGYLELARGALEHAEDALPEFEQAITGPVARGDEAAFERQLDELARRAPELQPLVLELAAETRRRLGRQPP